MATGNPTTSAGRRVNSQDPSTWLKPGQRLMAGGYDFAWCYVWFEEAARFPGYQVGSNGTLWSRYRRGGRRSLLPEGEWRQFAPSKAKSYPKVSILAPDGRIRNAYLHMLVAETFLGLRPDGKECRHLNGNPKDARLSNLWWGTHRENEEDKVAHGTRIVGENVYNARLTPGTVKLARRLRRDGLTYERIGQKLGVSMLCAYDACTGKTWASVPE